MLRTITTALLTAGILATSIGPTAAQDDPEAGDISVAKPAKPAHKAAVQEQPEGSVHDSAPARRRAGGTPGPLRLYGGFSVAVGGERQEDIGIGEVELELDPTVGIQMGADYVVMKYFSIGGEMRFLWSKANAYGERDFLWDLAVKPRGRYPFDSIPLEVYGTLPIGLTVAALEDPADGSPGFNIGLLAGATWFFTKNLGVNAELGWQMHKYGRELQVVGLTGETDLKINQFVILCPNFVYAL